MIYCNLLTFSLSFFFFFIFSAAARTAWSRSGLFLRMSPATQNPPPLIRRVVGRMMPKLN